MVAKVKFPELANAKLALPTLMMEMNPVYGGIVLASIMAAILSTISPIILASGTMITKDIFHRIIKPEATDKEILLALRITTALPGIACIILAMMMYGNKRILDMVYFAYTLRGSLFVVLLFGIYWNKTSQRGSIWAMLITTVIGFFWVAYKGQVGHYPLHPALTETYAAVISAFILTIAFTYIFQIVKI